MKTFVFCIRISAIGDAIMCYRPLRVLKSLGLEPILVSDLSLSAVALQFDFLSYFAAVEKGSLVIFKVRNNAPAAIVSLKESQSNTPLVQLRADQKVLEKVEDMKAEFVAADFLILDLQVTARSKKTYQILRAVCSYLGGGSSAKMRIWKIKKNTLLRIWLVVWARVRSLFLGQRALQADLCFDRKTKNSVMRNQLEVVWKIAKHLRVGCEGASLPPENTLLQCGSQSFSVSGEVAYITLVPGASSFVKQWPKEYFAEFIQIILRETNLNIMICGGNSELSIGEFLAMPGGEKHPRIKNCVGALTLQQTFALLRQSKFALTGDTFATHLADLHGVKGAVIFGPTSPDFGFSPASSCVKVLYRSLSCSPCTRHGKSPCRYNNLLCMRSILPSEVYEEIKDDLR